MEEQKFHPGMIAKHSAAQSSLSEILTDFKAKYAPPQKPIPTMTTPLCYTPTKVIVKQIFPLQLGAAVTVDKAQGRTLDKVVACLSHRNDNIYQMKINAIFVTLSRVRKRDDLRLLIHDDSSKEQQLKYIEKLSHDKEYFDYLLGFDESDHGNHTQPMSWDQTKALERMAARLHQV